MPYLPQSLGLSSPSESLKGAQGPQRGGDFPSLPWPLLRREHLPVVRSSVRDLLRDHELRPRSVDEDRLGHLFLGKAHHRLVPQLVWILREILDWGRRYLRER